MNSVPGFTLPTMAKTVTVFIPNDPQTFTEGSASVHAINVKFYFANVVQIIIIMDNKTKITYYQVPCILNEPPPII